MKERPINLKAEEVNNILEGRKTQTRRVMRPQPTKMELEDGIAFCAFPKWFRTGGVFKSFSDALKDICPYGQVGDRLWVRETWRTSSAYDHLPPLKIQEDASLWFEADKSSKKYLGDHPGKARSSIHMPRWASRIELEITGMRVERLQEISEEDARAEGIVWKRKRGDEIDPRTERFAKPVFAATWDLINARRDCGWCSNPFVWVIEFKAVQP